MKLSKTQQAVLDLMRDGWVLKGSREGYWLEPHSVANTVAHKSRERKTVRAATVRLLCEARAVERKPGDDLPHVYRVREI